MLIEDGVNGMLVPSDAPEALADALEKLRADDALVDRISTAARTSVREHFDGEKLAITMLGLLGGRPGA